MERRASNLMQAARQLEIATGGRVQEGKGNTLDNFERALGISQHHDAITGNNKQLVAEDYSQRLSKGMDEGINLMKERIGKLVSQSDLCHCMLSNQTRSLFHSLYSLSVSLLLTYTIIFLNLNK